MKTVFLSIDEVVALKKTMDAEFGLYLHFHDSCGGGQSFEFDQPVPAEVQGRIQQILADRGRTAEFEGNRSFVVLEKQV